MSQILDMALVAFLLNSNSKGRNEPLLPRFDWKFQEIIAEWPALQLTLQTIGSSSNVYCAAKVGLPTMVRDKTACLFKGRKSVTSMTRIVVYRKSQMVFRQRYNTINTLLESLSVLFFFSLEMCISDPCQIWFRALAFFFLAMPE